MSNKGVIGMKTKSIGFKMTLVISCILMAGIIMTTGISVVISSNAIQDVTLSKAMINTQSEANIMDSWLDFQMANINTLADVLSSSTEFTQEELESIFASMIDNNDSYFDVYMGFPDGTAINGSGYDYNYSTWTSYELLS